MSIVSFRIWQNKSEFLHYEEQTIDMHWNLAIWLIFHKLSAAFVKCGVKVKNIKMQIVTLLLQCLKWRDIISEYKQIVNRHIEEEHSMKMKNAKTVLAAALMAVTVMASSVTAGASSAVSSGTPGESSAPSEEQASQVQSFAEKNSVSADATVMVGGVKMKTAVEGVYAASSVQGCAIKADLSSVKAALGLKSNQKPVVIIYDTDVQKSNKAMASVNAAVEALGGELVSSLNIDLGAKENGKWVTLKDGTVAMTVGLPKDADPNKEYVVVCVQPGGVTTILENMSQEPGTIVFEVRAGLGTYAIVAR